MMRETLKNAMKAAMKAKESERLSVIRMVLAAIKDQDIAARSSGNEDGINDKDIMSLLGKLVKQRADAARIYEDGARMDLAAKETAEIAVIEEFLPKKLSDEAVEDAINAAIKATEGSSLKDMGKIMGYRSWRGHLKYMEGGTRICK